MISPTRFSPPTRTMSYMRAPIMPSATTAGPEILAILPWMAMSSSPLLQLDVEADRAPHQVLHVSGGVVALAECGAQAGHRQDHGQIPTSHRTLGGGHGIGHQPLVDDHQSVGVLLDQRIERLRGSLGLRHAHLDAGEPVAGRRLGVGEHHDFMHTRAPSRDRPAERGSTRPGPAAEAWPPRTPWHAGSG